MELDKYITKDSGVREIAETGMQRDTQDGKPRYDLIPVLPLRRLAMLYMRGAKKYNDWNWSLGMPYSRFLASAMRHLFQWVLGERDEDHLAAVVFNIFCIMYFEDMGKNKEFDDVHSHYQPKKEQ